MAPATAVANPGLTTTTTSVDDESDWEYEYHDFETEEVYFTLDLTTHVPTMVKEKDVNSRRLRNPAYGSTRDLDSAPSNGGAHRPASGKDVPANVRTTSPTAEDEPDKVQFLGLHTKDPYIKCNNSFFSCYWHSDLGTQLYVSSTGVVQNPRFAGHVLDVIGSSQAKLIGVPATLKRKRESSIDLTKEDANPNTNDNCSASDDEQDEMLGTPYETTPPIPNEPITIARKHTMPPRLAGQASFMERLSALRHKKGETDAGHIPLRMPVYYRSPQDHEAIRAAAEGRQSDGPTPASLKRAAQLQQRMPTRGGPRGGAPSKASLKADLGLDLPPPETPEPASETRSKRRGRPTNAELARRKAEAQAKERAAREKVIDPRLTAGGGARDERGAASAGSSGDATAQAGAGIGEKPINEALGLPMPKPKKGRRTKAQLLEAERLQAERIRAGDEDERPRRRTTRGKAADGGATAGDEAAMDGGGDGEAAGTPDP